MSLKKVCYREEFPMALFRCLLAVLGGTSDAAKSQFTHEILKPSQQRAGTEPEWLRRKLLVDHLCPFGQREHTCRRKRSAGLNFCLHKGGNISEVESSKADSVVNVASALWSNAFTRSPQCLAVSCHCSRGPQGPRGLCNFNDSGE